MLRRTQPISFDGDTQSPGQSGGDSGGAGGSGIERRRHPRVRVDAASSEAGYTDRRKTDRRSVDQMRAELNYVYANANRDRSISGRLTGAFQKVGLKPSRVLLLLIALGSGGVAAYLATASQDGEPAQTTETVPEVVREARTRVLVANQSIAVGQRLSADVLSWEEWPTGSVLSDYVTFEDEPEAIEELGGTVARFELFQGDPIREQKLVQASQGFLSAILDEGLRGVSVRVTAESASGGFISPNDHVDVLVTRATPMGDVSNTILHNVRVLAIDAELGGGMPTEESAERPSMFTNQAIATLALNPAQAEVITAASGSGRLSLVLRSMSDVDQSQGSDGDAVNQAIRMTSPFWTGAYTGGNE